MEISFFVFGSSDWTNRTEVDQCGYDYDDVWNYHVQNLFGRGLIRGETVNVPVEVVPGATTTVIEHVI